MSISALESRLTAIPTSDGRLAEIRKWVSKLSDDAIDAMGGQAAVVAQVLALYDTYIVPLDLPGVPALAEPAVDAVVKRIITALIWSVDDEA